jgi:N6-L-threonylcarbamoyladenine synthase
LEKTDAASLVVAGGVAANKAVRSALQQLAEDQGRRFSVPPGWLCTDNAAMIGWAGAERFAAGLTDGLDVPARARWPLDPEGEKVRGAGVKA